MKMNSATIFNRLLLCTMLDCQELPELGSIGAWLIPFYFGKDGYASW